MRAKEARIQSNAGYPLGDQPGILSLRYRQILTAGEEKLARFLVRCSEIVVGGFSSLLRHLEPDRLASLPLAHIRPIYCVTVGSDVLDLQTDDVASPQLDIQWLD